MQPHELLEEVKGIIKRRGEQHGPYKVNLQNIAEMWTAYLAQRGKLLEGAKITAEEGAMLMVLLKVARTTSGEMNKDDVIDALGYLALYGGIVEQERPPANAIEASTKGVVFDTALYNMVYQGDRISFDDIPVSHFDEYGDGTEER